MFKKMKDGNLMTFEYTNFRARPKSCGFYGLQPQFFDKTYHGHENVQVYDEIQTPVVSYE